MVDCVWFAAIGILASVVAVVVGVYYLGRWVSWVEGCRKWLWKNYRTSERVFEEDKWVSPSTTYGHAMSRICSLEYELGSCKDRLNLLEEQCRQKQKK